MLEPIPKGVYSLCDAAADKSLLSAASLLKGGLEEGRRLGNRARRELAKRISSETTLPPFAEVIAPLAQNAARAVGEHVGGLNPDPVRVPHLPIRELLEQLLRIVGPALVDAWGEIIAPLESDISERYRAFSEELSEGRFEQVLARRTDVTSLLAEGLAAWAGGLVEVISHAQDDEARLAALLNIPAGLGPLESILPVGSDMHNGRQALLLVFRNGRVIHKPRDIRVDILVGALARAAKLNVQVPRMMPRGRWGWAAQVEASPCASVEDVGKFYRGAGHLLALAQTVGVRDLHAENLVASGRHVVCIDMEVCFVFDDGLEAGEGPRLIDTGLIPTDTASDSQDVSGLGRPETIRERTRARVCWSDAGAPELKESSETLVHSSHIPHTTRGAADPASFADAVESGYAEGISAIKSRAVAMAGLLEEVEKFEIRHVLRPTREYARVLDRALLDGQVNDQRSRALFLSRLYVGTPAPWRPLVRGEITALLRGEIPRITSTAGGRSMWCDGERANAVLPMSGLDKALGQLRDSWLYNPEEGRQEIRSALRRRCGATSRSGSSCSSQPGCSRVAL